MLFFFCGYGVCDRRLEEGAGFSNKKESEGRRRSSDCLRAQPEASLNPLVRGRRGADTGPPPPPRSAPPLRRGSRPLSIMRRRRRRRGA